LGELPETSHRVQLFRSVLVWISAARLAGWVKLSSSWPFADVNAGDGEALAALLGLVYAKNSRRFVWPSPSGSASGAALGLEVDPKFSICQSLNDCLCGSDWVIQSVSN